MSTENVLAPAIYLNPAFIKTADIVFQQLRNDIVWDERMKARKTASFGLAYNYSQMSYPAVSMPPLLQHIATAIETELGFLPNNCLLNYYPDGTAFMGFHSDSSAELAENTGVAIISLGSTRTIAYRNKHDQSIRFDYPLPNGSLLYMTNAIQEEWLHAIPKEAHAAERISITFRQLRQTS